MIRLEGDKVYLRSIERGDVELLYRWENDRAVWTVSETRAPYSRKELRQFIEDQQHGILHTHQLRLVICRKDSGTPVGLIDLFEFDPRNLRAGVGILIYSVEDRQKGYAAEAVALTEKHVRETLGLRELYCSIHVDNRPSIALFRSRGFREVGLRRNRSCMGGGWRDEFFFLKTLL